ncbi:MAG: cell division protein FtsA [Pseudomonadota bacterium]
MSPKQSAVGRGGSGGDRDLVAVADIGGSKITCLIARRPPPAAGDAPLARAPVHIIGAGHQLSRGVRGGVVIDLELAEAALRSAVAAAERMAGVRLRSIYVAAAFPQLQSRNFGVDVAIGGHGVTDEDLRGVLNYAADECTPVNARLVHAFPTAYSIDGGRYVSDPRGMFGERLSVNMHIASVAKGVLQTLEALVSRCHLTPSGFVATPFASGLATLVRDEAQLGAIAVDMGADLTSFAIFEEGELAYCDAVPIGGRHVSADIARGLEAPLQDAERLKTLHGSALAGAGDDRTLIDVRAVGDLARREERTMPRAALVRVIRPRVEEIFEMVRDRLRAAGAAPGRRIILTGGASQLNGARELAELILGRNVRLGRPISVSGLPDALSGPAFSASAGAIDYAVYGPSVAVFGADDAWSTGYAAAGAASGRTRKPFAEVGRWLRQNL